MRSKAITTTYPLLALLCLLLAGMVSPATVHAAPAATTLALPPAEPAVTTTTVTLIATEDQGMIESVPAFVAGGAPYFVLNGRPDTHSEDWNFMQFDLAAIPADATIVGAQLQLDVIGFGGPARDLEVGRADGDWEEGVTSWSTMPPVTWGGSTQTITDTGTVSWPLKPLVEGWHSGATLNHGVVVRTLDNGNNAGAQALTKDGVKAGYLPPRLVVIYSAPVVEGPRPDLGDAPDSTNHHGVNNTAYLGGILGQFPTVYDVPANQAAGPVHVNQTLQGWLGDALSREGEADQGPDQDAPRNNILRNTVTGAVADVADHDRADDGWRNRNLRFFDCARTQLAVRVSKAATATLNRMYLNVWFDGNRDGDWSDLGQCQPDENEPAQASYEWIVQNYIVDMTAIPAGGALDFNVLTQKVLNRSGIGRHWMRFTLSEAPAVQPLSGTDLPDGRGPHPQHPTLKAFQYGETEDLLQRSAPVGQDGTLEIQKRVITDGEPVEWIDYVTYEIRLRHNGGTQPMPARLRDVLPYPLIVYPTITGGQVEYIVVESPTGGVTPLQAQLEVIPPSGSNPPQQVIQWQGALAPDAEVVFTFQVRVLALCEPNQQTITFTNRAQALPKGGTAVTAEDTFSAKCIGYTGDNIDFETVPMTNTIDFDTINQVPWRGTIHNLHPVSVTVGIYQQPLTATLGAATADLDKSSPLLGVVTLAPNESKAGITVQGRNARFLPGMNELELPADYTVDLGFGYCLLPTADSECPDAALYPQLHGQIPFTVTVRPSDLGDAPDSTNHAGTAMAAYPGVQANFPTVFDPATGLPQGPRHSYPGPFHLGQQVSREAGADVGPDQDPLNNIVPAANDPDNDRFDDGTNLALWNLNHCQTTTLPVRVAITPQAVNYFQQLGTPAYLNIWLDSNRDGDWADATQCGQQPAVEQIVIDFPINVVGLGAGLQQINVPTGLVPWSTVDQPAWVRITLSERPANKTLTAGALSYGDGRGYALPFKTGETEDYYYQPTAANGPDVAVYLSGQTSKDADLLPAPQAATVDKLGNFEIQLFKIDYENIGNAPAQNALLEFQIPEQLRSQQLVIVKGTDASSANLTMGAGKISLLLPALDPNAHGGLVLGWYGCITCTVTTAMADVEYTASVNVTVDGDLDPSNNQRSTTLRGLLSSPIIGAFMDYTDDACLDRIISGRAVTNRTTVELRGEAAPNQIIAILIGLVKVAEVTSDADGNFQYTATLPAGLHAISAHNIVSPRDAASGLPTGRLKLLVNPALPYDPLSSCFVDSNGRAYAMPTLGYSFGATQTGSFVRSGATYHFSVNTNGQDPNQYLAVTFNDVLVSSLVDDDHDGTFVGEVTFPTALHAASRTAAGTLGLLVGGAGNQLSYSSALVAATTGMVTDRTAGQPVANAHVSLFVAQDADDSSRYYALLPASQSELPNPQVTAADGLYQYTAAEGLYRLIVTADGYQPYRTNTIAADAAASALNIALSPAVAEAPTHTVYMTTNGFMPATLTVAPGSVIAFVNVDLKEHSTVGTGWDSGLLASGESYQVKLSATGSFSFRDEAGGLAQGVITVSGDTFERPNALYLPLVQR